MPALSAQLGWSLVVGTAAFLILAIAVIVTIVLHSRKIAESEKKFRLLFNQGFNALILFNSDQQVVDVNNSACDLLVYSKNELSGRNMAELFPAEKWTSLETEIDKIFKSEIGYVGETTLMTKNGRKMVTEVGFIFLKIDSKPHILGSFRDISTHKKALTELSKKNAILKELITHIEDEKTKYKKQLASTIRKILMPSMDKLVENDGSINKLQYDQLKENLEELVNSSSRFLFAYPKLSPREVEICNLIKNGASSKDIAESLSLSVVTINKHRERIRKKLVISNRNINLSSFLKD
jgi:PAS domain S-box-containing protein